MASEYYPYDSDPDHPEADSSSLSRRDMLKHGTAAIVGGGAAMLGGRDRKSVV